MGQSQDVEIKYLISSVSAITRRDTLESVRRQQSHSMHQARYTRTGPYACSGGSHPVRTCCLSLTSSTILPSINHEHIDQPATWRDAKLHRLCQDQAHGKAPVTWPLLMMSRHTDGWSNFIHLESDNLRLQQLIVRPIAVAANKIVYTPEEIPKTISATCTQEMLPITMEPRWCLRKEQRSNERTKMLDAEKQHSSRPKKDLERKRGSRVETSSESSYRHCDSMS